MNRIAPLLAACLSLCLSGCVTNAIRATSTDGKVRHFTDGELNGRSSCPLRVCIMNPPNATWRNLARVYSRNFAESKNGSVPDASACDIGMKFTNINGDHSDIYSGFTGEHLLRIDAIFRRAAKIVCTVFSPDEPLGAKIAEQRRRAGLPDIPGAPAIARAPAPAAAPSGLSAADIERIAKAVQGAAPAAPKAAPAASFPASPAPKFSAAERPHDLAVIVGVETYSDIAAKAAYAERDADAFKAYVRALGVPERNIVLLTGSKAVRSALTKNIEGWLPRMAKPDSRVYFYFSGHGAPDVKTGQAYLVPWDGDPNFLEATAYPVAQLYQKLGALPAEQVLVAMDSCFSGAGGRSVLASGARPLVGRIDTGAAPAKITVLAASAANEISGSLDGKGHGAFTYFLLEGMNAGKTTPKALNEYLTPRVQDEARRLNRDQTPQLQGDGAWSLR